MANKYQMISDEKVVEILQEAKNGVFLQDLEKKYGVTYSTLINWCNKTAIVAKKKPRGSRHDWEAIKRLLK